jgi:hypothetical protein
MRKPIVLLAILFLLLIPASARVYINKTAPSDADVGAKTMVALEIFPDSAASTLDIVESVPLPLEITDWSVSGYDEAKVSFEKRVTGAETKYHWTFSEGLSQGQGATLTYFFYSPTKGKFNLTTLYLFPAGFDRITKEVKIEESRLMVLMFAIALLALLIVLYWRERSRKGERKLFHKLGNLIGRKKSLE